MADNTTLPATGTGTADIIVATDKIGGVDYQREKIVWGPDGTATDADKTAAAALPVQAVGTGTNGASQVTITNSSTTVIASRAGRRGVLILNKQTVAVSIDASGGTAVYATHFVLDPGASVFLPVTNAVTAITSAAYTASGDAKLHLVELLLVALDIAAFVPPMLGRSDVCITPWSMQSLGPSLRVAAQEVSAGQNYVTANLVVYVPFWVPEPVTFTKMFWVNGSAVTGAYDVGIYATDGTLLISKGSTSAAGTSNIQSVDITETTVARGNYYMAILSDTSAVGQKIIAVVPSAGIPQSLGLLQQASVTIPLSTNAAPATFAKYASAFIPLFGVQGYRTIGP